MGKWFLRGGLGLLAAMVIFLGYLTYDLFWPSRFTPPARIMPAGAVLYVALDHLEAGWQRVEQSGWWQGLTRQLTSDRLVRLHLERLRRELSRASGFDLTRSNLMSLLRRHASLSLYPSRSGPGWPGLGGLNWLAAVRVDHRLILLKWFMDVRSWVSSRSELTYLRRQGHRVGRIQTETGPVFFWVRGDHTVFLAGSLDLIQAVLARLEPGGLPRLSADPYFQRLKTGRPGQTVVTGFVRLGHPRLAAWRARLAGLLAARLPRPAPPLDLIAWPAPLVLALYHPWKGIESIDAIRLESDLAHTRLIWTLRPRPPVLGRIYAAVLDPAGRLKAPDLLDRSPLIWFEQAGLRPSAYVAACGWHPLIKGWLTRKATLLGLKSAREVLDLAGSELAVLVVDLNAPGFLPWPNVAAILRMKDPAAAGKLRGGLVKLIKAQPQLTRLLTHQAGPRGRIDFLALPGMTVGLTAAGAYLVAGNDLSLLAAAQRRPGLRDNHPAWRAAITNRQVQYLLFISPGRILARPEQLVPILNLLGLSSRTLPLFELGRVVDWLRVTSRWDGRSQARIDIRLKLVDRPIKGRLPLGLIRRWLAGLRLSPLEPPARRSPSAGRHR
jgi:hypothetical protein